MTNTNLLFQRELSKELGLTKFQTEVYIGARAQKVAELAGVEFGGMDKRGMLFLTSFVVGREIAAPTVFFPYETVLDEPSQVIAWGREQRDIYGKVAA